MKTNARVIAHSVRGSYVLLSCKINDDNLKQEVNEQQSLLLNWVAETYGCTSRPRGDQILQIYHVIWQVWWSLTSHSLKRCLESTYFTYFSVRIYRSVYAPASSDRLLGTICWWWLCNTPQPLHRDEHVGTATDQSSVHALKQALDMSGMRNWGKRTWYVHHHMAHVTWGTESTGSYQQNPVLEMQILIKERNLAKVISNSITN